MLAFSSTGQLMISPNTAGLLLCTEGNAELLINGTKHKFARGSLCIISPFLNVELSASSSNCKWEMICDNKDIFNSMAICIFNNLVKNPCLVLDEKRIGEFMFFVDKINYWQSMLDTSKEEDFAMIRHNITLLEQAAGTEFISQYFQERPFSSYKQSRKEKVVYDFINLLSHNYSTQRSVSWYAEQVNLSPAYFSQIVRHHTGLSPIEWIKDITIANAKMLLTQPNVTIKEVAAKLNFSEQFTFRKYFKNCTGMAPSQYREMMRRK